MNQENVIQVLSSTYRYFMYNCVPETITTPSVMKLVEMARYYLSTTKTETNVADIVRTQVYLRNAAETILKRAVWIDADAQQSLLDFIREQPEFMIEGAYKFTHDSFSDNIDQWRKHLGRFAGLPHLNFLEVGSFEGRSACWLLQNILTHETSKLVCVDVFDEEESQGLYDTNNLNSASMSKEQRFEHNVCQTGARHRVEKIKGRSQEVLRFLQSSFYDFIYLDASHIAKDVLEDAVYAWPLLKEGGIMTFDDYLWPDNPDPLLSPQLAIDAFLKVYDGHYRLVHQGYQVTLEKLS
jgi:predicted O-methyltransferase YrrM